MVKIVFRNTEKNPPGEKVFIASGVHVFTRSIVAVINGKEQLLAVGGAHRWRVGLRLYTSVEIQSIETFRKAA
jgi:hypothetical protein